MQNSSPNQMYMLLTRIGINSRMVITGDLEQSDKFENNGLKDVLQKFKLTNNLKNILLVELDKTDVQRSELVKNVMKLYEPKEPKEPKVEKKIEEPKPISSTTTPIKTKMSKLIMEITQNGDNDAALMPRKHLIK
jgi:hypothetical protein